MSAGLAPQSVVFCYDSPKKLINKMNSDMKGREIHCIHLIKELSSNTENIVEIEIRSEAFILINVPHQVA